MRVSQRADNILAIGFQWPRVRTTREARRVVNRKPEYHRLNQMEGPDERLCNGTILLAVITCRSTALCRSNWDGGGEMLSKKYLDTAQTYSGRPEQ
jgi:hypothetical protein